MFILIWFNSLTLRPNRWSNDLSFGRRCPQMQALCLHIERQPEVDSVWLLFGRWVSIYRLTTHSLSSSVPPLQWSAEELFAMSVHHYCGRKCQKLDGIECHKDECPLLSTSQSKVVLVRDCDRFLLRLWMSSQCNRRQSETHELFNGMKRSLEDLMTHSQEIGSDAKRVEYL